MSVVVDSYKKSLLVRYNKDVAIPYYSYNDFPGLKHEEYSFVNSLGINISYFIYYFDNYIKDKVIILCPGMGPGHTAYFAEINSLCKRGYKVISLDYTGCGTSGGDILNSLYQPTRDVNELITHLKLKEEIVLFGHSLGAFTALNVINMNDNIKTAVIISPFIDISSLMIGYTKLRFLADKALKFELENNPDFKTVNNWQFLKTNRDNILFIHSKDDKVVNFKHNTGKLLSLKNSNLKIVVCDKKNHNPTYKEEAVKYLNETMDGYAKLIAKENVTDEERLEYFKNVSIDKMTEQDDEIINLILDFINQH